MRTLTVLSLFASTALAVDPLTLVSWNVESGGADSAIISEQIAELPKATLFALQEVGVRELGHYGNAIRSVHDEGYHFVRNWTGPGDRLPLAFDENRLELLKVRELYTLEGKMLNKWRQRSPLVGDFHDKQTDHTFLVVTVHLARASDTLGRRGSQAGPMIRADRSSPWGTSNSISISPPAAGNRRSRPSKGLASSVGRNPTWSSPPTGPIAMATASMITRRVV